MTNRSNESEQQQLYKVPKEDKIAFVNPEIFSHIGTIFFGKKKNKDSHVSFSYPYQDPIHNSSRLSRQHMLCPGFKALLTGMQEPYELKIYRLRNRLSV